MIRSIDIKLNAAHPELPIVEATTFTGAPSSVFIRGVPKSVGNWSITAVNVAVTYPDNSTTTRAAVESAEGVWVATIPGTATSGRTTAGFRILADGIDENGAAVTGYVLGFADFSVLSFTPVPAPGGTFYLLRYFDQAPATPKEGDAAKIDGVLKFYNGSAWESFAAPPTLDDAVTRTSANGVKSSGIWSAIWGALSALPTGFTSLYDWVVAQLAGKASVADATLTERGPNHDGFSAWNVQPVYPSGYTSYTGPTWVDAQTIWVINFTGHPEGYELSMAAESGNTRSSLSITFGNGTTATRTALSGYQLGSQADKPLASEAEAEALRTGKLDKSAVVSPSSSATAGQAADAKATGDALGLIAPDWVQTSAYSAYDCVKYNGAYYYAKQDIAANTTWSTADWGSLANLAAVVKKFLPLTGGRVYSDIRIGYEMFIGADGTARAPENGIWWSDFSGYNFPKCGIQCGSLSGDLVLFSGGAQISLPIISGTLALLKDIAPAFSTSATYAVNALCVHEGVLYRCVRAHTATSWVSANWTEATVEDILAALRTAIAGKADVSAIPYALVTKTITSGAVSLNDRASNSVTISATLSPNTLTINFPTTTSGKVRDFAMRLNIAAGVTAPEIAWPQGVTLENNGGEVPEIADGGTGGSSTILYFSETENNGTTAKFLVKGETLTAIAQE